MSVAMSSTRQIICYNFNPLNAELNPICHLLALLGAHHIFHVSGLRVNLYWLGIFKILFALLSEIK